MGLKELQDIKANAKVIPEKKIYRIPKVSKKRQKALDAMKDGSKIIYEESNGIIPAVVSGGGELERWFLDRRKEMTGFCKHCGGQTTRDNDEFYKCSIAHILPKAYFKSVATNEHNWIELCFWNNSCHTNLDNKMLDLIDLNCFDLVIERFAKMYPSIAKEERRRIPKVLMEYLETEK